MERPLSLWILIHICVFVWVGGREKERCETHVHKDFLINTSVSPCPWVVVHDFMLPNSYCEIDKWLYPRVFAHKFHLSPMFLLKYYIYCWNFLLIYCHASNKLHNSKRQMKWGTNFEVEGCMLTLFQWICACLSCCLTNFCPILKCYNSSTYDIDYFPHLPKFSRFFLSFSVDIISLASPISTPTSFLQSRK